MPTFTKKFRFDNLYFCVKTSATNADRLQTFLTLKWRRFFGNSTEILQYNWTGGITDPDVFVENILI